jgi:hypothetical protein
LIGGAVLLVAVLGVLAPEFQVSAVDGNSTTGRLQHLSANSLDLKTPEGNIALPLKQVLSLAPVKPPRTAPSAKTSVWIELVDGSRLTAQQITIHHGAASVDQGADKPLELPTAAIRRVRFSDPDNPKSPAWPSDADAPAAADRLIVRAKSGVDLMEGVIGDVTPERVEFKVDDETVPAQRAKIDGLIFFHKTGEDLPDAMCVVDDPNGAHLKAKSVMLEGGRLQVTTLAGPVITQSLESVSRLDFSAGKLIYLSDLTPESTHWTSYFDYGESLSAVAQFYAPHRDEGPERLPLTLGGKAYAKGLSIYSRTEIQYRIPSGVKSLKATTGIDDAVRPLGTVHLVISVDGRPLLDRAISGADAPIDLDLEVAGARRLTILVDFGGNQDAGDYLDLADARMLK